MMLGSTETKNLKNLLQFLWVLLFTFTFLVTPTSSVSFPRSARAQPKIDLREFPDTQGICRGPGFHRNETDCTQFYRCVDFDINVGRTAYTIFKFICGPMTIFDESRSVCTGPELAYPPCTDEVQLAEIFPQMTLSTGPTFVDIFTENPLPEMPNNNIITEPTVETVIAEKPGAFTNPPDILPKIEIGGFLVIGPTDIFDLQHQLEPFQDVTIPSYNTWGVVSHGKGSVITIQIEGANRGSSWTLPPGAIFIMNPIQNEGIVNNITPERVSTNSTTASFPSGANFFIILIGSRGQIIGTRSLPTTTVATKVTIPPLCIINTIIVDEELIGIGDWYFSTQQVSTSQTTFTSFGILHKDPLSTIASTSLFEEYPPFISGILAIGNHHDSFGELNELVVNGADLVGIIPRDDEGIITLQHDESKVNFTVNPGSIFVILSGGSGTISNLAHESISTTRSTTIFFPAGSLIGILKIGINGQLTQETLIEMSVGFQLSSPPGSLIGLLRLNEERIITSIGNRAFSVQPLAGSQRYFGLINLNSIVSYSQLERLQGIITLGAPSLNGAWETIDILPNTVTGIVTSGLVQITEQDSDSIKHATLNLPSGSILGISTSSTQSGKVGRVINGFLSGPGQFTFPTGAIIGMITIRMDGTMVLENRFTTTDLTSLVVPPGSTFGTICLTADGIVKGLGETVFATQYFLMDGSSVGHYGVIRYEDEYHQLSQASISSNSYNIIDPVQVIPIYDGPESNTVPSTLSVPSDSSVAFFPAKSIGEITIINLGRSTLTIPILPGHFLGFLNTQRLIITDLLDGFFTTQTTTISVGAGTVLGIYKIGRNGEMIPVENIGMIDDESTVFLPIGSSLGILHQEENIITDIGGATLNIVMVSSTTNPDSESLSYIGIWDIDEFLSQKSILKSTTDPFPSSISAIIPIHSGSYSSISTASVQPGKSIAILPVKEPGDIVITEKEGSEFLVKLLPGQGLLVFNTAQTKGDITDLNDGFFSSESTVVSLPAGSSYTTFYIAKDNSLITADNIVNIASRDLNLKLPIGSIVGDLGDKNDDKLSTIGGASLIVKPVPIKSTAVDKLLVGLVDVAGYLANKPLLLKEASSDGNLLPPNKECLNLSNNDEPSKRSTEK